MTKGGVRRPGGAGKNQPGPGWTAELVVKALAYLTGSLVAFKELVRLLRQ
jgi:hypothetical protein